MEMRETSAPIIQSEATTVTPDNPLPPIHATPAPDGDGFLFVTRAGYTVQHRPGPTVMSHRHRFDDVGSFAAWLNRHANPHVCDILVAPDRIDAYLNPEDPRGARVHCLLSFDPRFALWNDALGHRQRLADFLQFIRAARSTIGEQIAAMILSSLRDFSVSRNAKTDIRTHATGMISYSAHVENKEIAGELPAEFVARVPIFAGVEVEGTRASDGKDDVSHLALYDLPVYLCIDDTGPGGILFGVDCPELPLILSRARLDAAAMLQRLLAEDFLVGLGVVALEEMPLGEGDRVPPERVPAPKPTGEPSIEAPE